LSILSQISDPDPGIDDKKFKYSIVGKFVTNFLLGHGEASSPPGRRLKLLNLNFCFSLLCVILAFLDLESESGSAGSVKSGCKTTLEGKNAT
jgi:hypothetical protein